MLNEIAIISCVSNPFIVQSMGSYQDKDHLYMMLEFVGGGELRVLQKKQDWRRFPAEEAKFKVAEISMALRCVRAISMPNLCTAAIWTAKIRVEPAQKPYGQSELLTSLSRATCTTTIKGSLAGARTSHVTLVLVVVVVAVALYVAISTVWISFSETSSRRTCSLMPRGTSGSLTLGFQSACTPHLCAAALRSSEPI